MHILKNFRVSILHLQHWYQPGNRFLFFLFFFFWYLNRLNISYMWKLGIRFYTKTIGRYLRVSSHFMLLGGCTAPSTKPRDGLLADRTVLFTATQIVPIKREYFCDDNEKQINKGEDELKLDLAWSSPVWSNLYWHNFVFSLTER